MYCRNCGEIMNDNQAICLKCGVKTGEGTAFCSNCGNNVTDDMNFCYICGSALNPSPTVPKKGARGLSFIGMALAIASLVCNVYIAIRCDFIMHCPLFYYLRFILDYLYEALTVEGVHNWHRLIAEAGKYGVIHTAAEAYAVGVSLTDTLGYRYAVNALHT